MSRRASLFKKENPDSPKRSVRFPDELVFLDNIKEHDTDALKGMLRRASVQIDINAITDSGMAPLHQAVVEGNLEAAKLLLENGADVNKADEDTWTPLHAACAEGYIDIARLLLEHGADRTASTADGERPIDLVDAEDFPLIAVMLDTSTKHYEVDDATSKDCSGDESENINNSATALLN